MGKDADMERFLTVTSGVNPMYIYILVLCAHSTEAQIHFTGYTMTQLATKRFFSGQNFLFYSFSLWKAFSDSPGDAWSRTKMWQSHFQVLGLKEWGLPRGSHSPGDSPFGSLRKQIYLFYHLGHRDIVHISFFPFSSCPFSVFPSLQFLVFLKVCLLWLFQAQPLTKLLESSLGNVLWCLL